MRFGIRREDKSETERRAPLVPRHVNEIINEYNFEIFVESSKKRIFNDEEYLKAGAKIVKKLPDNINLILGVKEIPVNNIFPEKAHLFFSHTIKGQPYNMPLLKRIIDDKSTLIDYECIRNSDAQRLIFFSYQAGQAGMINCLWALGQRLDVKNINTPLKKLNQANTYKNLNEIKGHLINVFSELTNENICQNVKPIIVGIAGYGNVSKGAQDVLDVLNPVELQADELNKPGFINSLDERKTYKVVFHEEEMVELKEDESFHKNIAFDVKDYYKNPHRYQSTFAKYLPSLTIFVNAIYWEPQYPRFITKEDLRRTLNTIDNKLTVIGDITCDIDGSIEATVKASTHINPVYDYNPFTGKAIDGFAGDGISVMAVDVLPNEIPSESTEAFGEMLLPLIPPLVNADYTVSFEKLNLPEELLGAVIAHKGILTPKYSYLMKYLKS